MIRQRSLRTSAIWFCIGRAAVAMRVLDAEGHSGIGFWRGPGLDTHCGGSFFLQRGRVVVGEQFKVETVGDAYGLLALRGVVAGFGVLAGDARQKESTRVLEVGDEF